MWLKQFRKKKLQSALIFIVVTLCSLLITGSVIILTSLSSPYSDLRDETKCPDVRMYPAVQSAVSGKDWIEYLSEIDGVEKAEAIQSCDINSVFINGKKEELFVNFTKFNDCFANVRVIEGSLDDLTDGTCAMPSSQAYDNKLSLGDTVSIPDGDSRKEYKIVAIFADIYSMSTAFTSDILVSSFGENAIITENYAVYFNDGYTSDEFIADYTAKNDGILDGNLKTTEYCIGNAALTEKILGGVLLGISACIFIVILLIITYIIKSSLRRDKTNIAIYKSLGYTEGKIARIYITFYQTIILVGTIVGAMSSVIVSIAFMQTAYKNLGIENTSADLWQKALCAAVINIIAFLILVYEFGKLKSLKPVEILTGSEEYGRKKLKEKRGFISSFSPLAMALRMFVREKRRSAIIIITCIVSVYIVNISVVCLQNLTLISGETNYYWLGIDNHDVSVEETSETVDLDSICEKLSADENVARLTKKNYDLGYAIPYHESVSATVMESYDGLDMAVVAGRNPLSSNEIAIGNIFLKELGLEIGDYMDVCLDKDTTVRLMVVGTYQGFYNLGKSIRLLGATLEENSVAYKYNAASIVLKDGADKAAFIDDVESKYGNYVTAIDRYDLYGNVMNMICEPQKSALLPFVIITVIIGAVNLFYIIYSNNCDNRKKNTILRSVGYSASHILKTNLIYVAIIAAASVAIAIPALIYVFPQIMVLAMSGFGFAEYRLLVEPLTVVLVNGGMFLLFLLITLATGKDLYKNHLNRIVNE